MINLQKRKNRGNNGDKSYKVAAKDKVLLTDESKGEVMISEGARDYVPPTEIEDWVWPYPKK